MQARDIMMTHVVTVGPDASVQQVAEILDRRGISAVPVVGERGEVIGIVSEGDLMRRSEIGTVQTRSWWLGLLLGEKNLAAEFIKANARKVADVMTRKVITAAPDTPLGDIAAMLERNSIKRVPIVNKGQLVGIVSRANLIHALAMIHKQPRLEITPSDTTIREKLIARLKAEPWAETLLLNVLVNDGVVDLWGFVRSIAEKNAVRVAAETMPGVRAVNDNLVIRPYESWT